MSDIYSVWNWEKGRYDYYRSNSPRAYRQRIGYPSARGLKGVGEIAEQSVHPLPADAQFAGEGDEAIGTIASESRRNRVLLAIGLIAGLVALGFYRKSL